MLVEAKFLRVFGIAALVTTSVLGCTPHNESSFYVRVAPIKVKGSVGIVEIKWDDLPRVTADVYNIYSKDPVGVERIIISVGPKARHIDLPPGFVTEEIVRALSSTENGSSFVVTAREKRIGMYFRVEACKFKECIRSNEVYLQADTN